MTRMSDKPDYLIRSFESAHEEYVFLGTIPVWSDDNNEQRSIDAARRRIKTNYTKARNRLMKALKAGEIK